MKINNNIAALNAWRNLGLSNAGMASSLEKLSSGYKINRGADDPAGLLISEKLRAQITGLNQAISNASDAVSMVQTAEGALTEMNTMLNSIRGLAVHAANTSANDTSSIEADQTAVDKAVESIQRIATTTKFAGKLLLDGSARGAEMSSISGTLAEGTDGITIAVDSTDDLTTAGVEALLGTDDSGEVNVVVTAVATEAIASATASAVTTSGAAGAVGSLSNGGASLTLATTAGSITIDIAADGSVTIASMVSEINDASIGLTASAEGSGGMLKLTLTDQYGTDSTFDITAAGSAAGSLATVLGLGASGTTTVSGTNIQGKLTYGSNEVSLVGATSGAAIFTSEQSGWTGLTLTLDEDRATNVTESEQGKFLLDKNGEKLKFSLTPDASSSDIITYGIANMQITKIGTTMADGITNEVGTYSGLNAITTNGAYNLTDEAEKAVAIIDQAITDVSSERSQLGSFQKFTLETTINNLGVTRENLTASESRIRDADMAQEMMNFTKNQILVQAGTAMLAQANQVPSSVLQLLQ